MSLSAFVDILWSLHWPQNGYEGTMVFAFKGEITRYINSFQPADCPSLLIAAELQCSKKDMETCHVLGVSFHRHRCSSVSSRCYCIFTQRRVNSQSTHTLHKTFKCWKLRCLQKWHGQPLHTFPKIIPDIVKLKDGSLSWGQPSKHTQTCCPRRSHLAAKSQH